MGRLPVIQNEKSIGRDHNTYGFSMWLAGGGVKGGCIHGETDELGHKAVKDVVTHHDYHATLLHLFGLTSEQVAFTRPTGVGSLLDGQTGQRRVEHSQAGTSRKSQSGLGIGVWRLGKHEIRVRPTPNTKAPTPRRPRL